MDRLSTHLLIRPEDLTASYPDWKVIGTFNPGAVRFGKEIVLLVRVAERPTEQREGWTALPRWTEQGYVVDWIRDEELEILDPRVVRRRDNGLVRLTFVSHLRVARSRDGITIDSVGPPVFAPACSEEEFGVEDPRITELAGRFYITYVAVSKHGPATALASTRDFEVFERHGTIFCPENKDVVLFPAKFGDYYVALHRPVGHTPFTKPEMWIARSPDLFHWGAHQYLYGGGQDWEAGRVGAGTPPLRTSAGWLEIYHGNQRTAVAGEIGAYCGAALLLDSDNPNRILRVGQRPLLRPELELERQGFVRDVVFPTGIVEDDDRLFVYYGASDQFTAVATFSRAALLDELRPV